MLFLSTLIKMHALECIPFIGNVLECLATVGAAFFGVWLLLYAIFFEGKMKKDN